MDATSIRRWAREEILRRGFELGPKALKKSGEVRVHEEDRFVSCGSVEEREVSKNTFSWAQKRI
jgi:hypothetical protein